MAVDVEKGPDESGATAPAGGRYGVRVDLTPNGTEETADTAEYLAFVRRILAALGRRVAHADIDALGAMVELRDEFDRHIEETVRKLRHDDDAPASWQQIGQAFGITRQAAQERFAHVGGARRRGGQPGNLR